MGDTGERKRFGERVRQLREQRGWPLDELAIRLEKSRASMSRIETGKQNLTFDDITAIAAALEVSTSTLFGGEHSTDPQVHAMAQHCIQKVREASYALHAATTAADTLERIMGSTTELTTAPKCGTLSRLVFPSTLSLL